MRIWGIERYGNFPFVHKLTNAVAIEFVLNSWLLLGPFEEAVKIDLIPATDYYIGQSVVFDRPANGFLGNAKQFRSFGNV